MKDKKVVLVFKDDLEALKLFWPDETFKTFLLEDLFEDERLSIYVIKENGQITAAALVFRHMMRFLKHNIGVGYISHLKAADLSDALFLLNEIMADQQYQNLLTLLKGDEELFKKTGFISLEKENLWYYQKIDDLKIDGYFNENPDIDDLGKAYGNYVSKFGLYNFRLDEDFIKLLKLWHLRGYSLLAYYEKGIRAYLVYHYGLKNIWVDEAIYNDEKALVALLNKLNENKKVIIRANESQDLSFLSDLDKADSRVFIGAKINDLSLFNALYNSDVTSIEQGLSLSRKVFFVHEEY